MAIFSTPLSAIQYPEFTTHKHYVAYMRRVSDSVSLKSSPLPLTGFSLSQTAKRKLRLIQMTAKNLHMEHQMVMSSPEFAEAAMSWTPVKTYYLLFNMVLLIEYLISTDSRSLTATHSNALKKFRGLIESGTVTFNSSELNEVHSGAAIEKMRVLKSDNLRAGSASRKEQILRKLLDYAKDEERRKTNVKKLRKQQMIRLHGYKFCLFDLFYWYRIKVNYRDLEFMTAGIPSREFEAFYKDYYKLTGNFFLALKNCLNDIAVAHGIGKVI
ncbi:MAG: hypothetical protein NUV88_03680 [Candidatus Kaiserbacteria bacterium]|nr:hypothetical protein [Candidatus Kaiserbacteria bacterium]